MTRDAKDGPTVTTSPNGPTDNKAARTWRAPTRRAFVAMIGAAAASLAVRDTKPAADPPRSTWSGTTRWIGHC